MTEGSEILPDSSNNKWSGKTQPRNIDTSEENDYPNQEGRDGADNEEFIIDNGINNDPNQTQSNKPEWIDGRLPNDGHIESSISK